METARIVLKEPFMKYPAGTVFELNALTGVSDWDPDERARERLSFSDKRTYYLPDMGRGYGVSLPASITAPCPEGVLEQIDLRSGPCRITEVKTGMGEAMAQDGDKWPCGRLRENDVSLLKIGDKDAQGLHIRLPEPSLMHREIRLTDMLRNELVHDEIFSKTTLNDGALSPDCRGLLPGFYQMLLLFPGDCRHSIRFVKSFPLLVQFQGNTGRYTLHQTLY